MNASHQDAHLPRYPTTTAVRPGSGHISSSSDELCTETRAEQRSEDSDCAAAPTPHSVPIGLAHPSLTPDRSSHEPIRLTRTHHREARL